jgi:hypothetical protein
MIERTTTEIAKIYSHAAHSVTLINNETSKDADETEQEWKDRIKRNWRHLEIIKAYKKEDGTTSIWTTEDFTAIDAAIIKGKEVQS